MITTRRAVISVILAGCAVLMVWGFTLVRPTNTPIVIKNSAVLAVTPAQSSSVLRQSSVSITLAPGFTLALESTEGLAIGPRGAVTGIPQDELQIQPGQNNFTYTFQPGAGRQFTELPAGAVCAIAQIQRTADPTAPPTPFSWCFVTQ